ncbi:beta-propeller domain-containing protein [Spirillospora sp. CA-255316]
MPSRRLFPTRAGWIACVPLAMLAGACSGAAPTGPGPAAPAMALVAYNGCDELLKGLRAAAEREVGPYGLGGSRGLPPGRLPLGAVPEGAVPDGAARSQAQGGAESGAAEKQAAGHSGTNTHEAGVDEPDLVKTDGTRIVTLADDRLQVIDAGTRKVVHRLDLRDAPGLPEGSPPIGHGQSQLLLSGDRVLIVTPHSFLMHDRPSPDGPALSKPAVPAGRNRTTLTQISLAGTPRIVGTMTTEGGYVDARQTGSTAHVVVTSTPRIDFPDLPRGPDAERRATERNRQAVRSAPLEAWLPGFEVRAGTAPPKTYRTPCQDVSRPGSQPGTTMLSVLTLDLARDLGDPRPVTVAADGQTVYGNGKSLYVTGRGDAAKREGTHVHRFDVSGGARPRYVASGSVPGRLLNQYSMSEHDGRLRIATTTSASPTVRPDGPAVSSTAARSQSAVHVLATDGRTLREIGKVDGLGKGERIYSVRFIGTTGYVVTFRQVDPLYVIDLRDPARPRVTGELKITGYSAYLHPVAGGRLLGVGQEASTDGRARGTQVSLFDVNGPPRRVGAYHLPGSSATAEFEPHAFLHWPRSGMTVLPISGRTTGSEALVLKVDATGVHRAGTVRHPGEDGYSSPIRRSLIVGDTLWTVSEQGARATDTATLAERAWLRF